MGIHNAKMLKLSLHGEVPLHDAFESVLELHVARRVAEGVDGRVQVAEEVGEHVEVHVDARGAKAGGQFNRNILLENSIENLLEIPF